MRQQVIDEMTVIERKILTFHFEWRFLNFVYIFDYVFEILKILNGGASGGKLNGAT